METQRLKSIQIPDNTLGLLESFARNVLRIPDGAQRVKQLDGLPQHLRRHVGVGQGKQYVWYAWTDGEKTRMITGTLSLERSRERGRPVLEVRIYDSSGLLDEAATWVRTGANEWARSSW